MVVCFLHHEDEQNFVPSLIDGAVVFARPHVDAVELLFRCELLHTVRARVLFQVENVPVHLLADVRIEFAEIPLRGGSDFNAVGQDSVPQFPHEVPEGDVPLPSCLFQGGAGIFEVQAVHFLSGQALQEPEVIHGNDSGQVLSTARDDGSLLSVGGEVHDFGKLFPRF